jgi:NDP-sugar pyrophosphorylase family protein
MKLEFSRHQSKLHSVTFTFDLLRWALKELSDAGFRRYMESLRKQKDARFKAAIKFFSADPYFTLDIQDLAKRHRRSLSAKLPVTPSLKWSENKGHAQLALNASELVLRVALFEAFLKEIHHQALLAEPKLLAHVKPNRSVSLKDLFRTGFEQFRCEEAHRQVREAD